jgi:hypothetical protein
MRAKADYLLKLWDEQPVAGTTFHRCLGILGLNKYIIANEHLYPGSASVLSVLAQGW